MAQRRLDARVQDADAWVAVLEGLPHLRLLDGDDLAHARQFIGKTRFPPILITTHPLLHRWFIGRSRDQPATAR